MCGIAGFQGDVVGKFSINEFEYFVSILTHRGPNNIGVVKWNNTFLGHARLSIIDLRNESNQPFFSDDKKLAIVFNGEIYNYKEIKAELSNHGFSFRTSSDTEVLLKSYQAWGKDCLSKLNGFFSFVIFNKQTRSFFCARDRVGIKPFYYYFKENQFGFASELKALVNLPFVDKVVNKKSLINFLQYQHIGGNASIYENIYKLLPGHFLEFSNGKLSIERYWTPIKDNFNFSKLNNIEEVKQDLKFHLESSVKLRLRADVKVGTFLSGGVDSSLITALASKYNPDIVAYTIGFDTKKFDESQFAKQVAKHLGVKHQVQVLTSDDARKIIDKLPQIYCEPFADSSAIPTYLLSKFAAEESKVMLSGDGGDELFWGYNRYLIQSNLYRKFENLPYFLRRFLSLILKGLPVERHKRLFEYLSNALKNKDIGYLAQWSLSNFHNKTLNNLLDKNYYNEYTESTLNINFNQLPKWNKLDSFSKLPYLDLFDYLPEDILTKVDRASMANSLEVRVPLLDHNIVELAYNLPFHYRYFSNTQKYLLKSILRDYLPDNLINKPKKGFEIPVDEWLRKELKEELLSLLNEHYLKQQGIFNPKEIKKQLTLFFERKVNNAWGIWTIFMFQKWYESWIKE